MEAENACGRVKSFTSTIFPKAVIVLADPLADKYPAMKRANIFSQFITVTVLAIGVFMVSVGKRVENFTLPATGDQNLSLSDFKGRNLVIYFYPKDNTSGCIREGQEFRDLYSQFEQADADILGVSRDSV